MHHEDENGISSVMKELTVIIVSAVLFIVGIIFEKSLHGYPLLEYGLFLTAYTTAGWKVIWKAVKNVKKGVVFDENTLMTIATVGAIVIHEMPEAVAVMLFFRVGEFLQDLALSRSRRSIKSLLEIRPTFANLKVDEKVERVRPEDVKVGDLIVVKPGEKIPLDGIIVEGSSVVDTSALTGESKPRSVKIGDEVLSGMINLSGMLTVRVTKPFAKSTVSKILELVEEARSRKAKAEKFITKFARYYTPVVIALAVGIATIPPLALNEPFSPWIYRALVLLVISCPCALVLSVPLSYFASIGKFAKEGILVKGSNFIDLMSKAKIVAFDKTGTLTKGTFKVVDVVAKNGFSKEDVLRFAALAELNSSHPIAKSILEAYDVRGLENLVESYEEIAGMGIKAKISGSLVIAGNDAMMHAERIEHDTCEIEGTVVHIAVDGKYAGYIIVSDEIKEDAKDTVAELRKLGCRVIMLTGDSKEVAEIVAKKLGIEEFHAELLPIDKVRIVRSLKSEGNTVFAGDGINDAPVLVEADVGIAMGALGSDAAIETADLVIMDDKISKIPKAIGLSRKTQNIVWQNITFVLAVKGLFVTLGSLGMATMWEAVFADVGVSLITALNAMRVFNIKI